MVQFHTRVMAVIVSVFAAKSVINDSWPLSIKIKRVEVCGLFDAIEEAMLCPDEGGQSQHLSSISALC